jgi:hypothetical protein
MKFKKPRRLPNQLKRLQKVVMVALRMMMSGETLMIL